MHIVCIFHANLMQISCKSHTNLMQISFKSHAYLMHIVCIFHANLMQIPYKSHAYPLANTRLISDTSQANLRQIQGTSKAKNLRDISGKSAIY